MAEHTVQKQMDSLKKRDNLELWANELMLVGKPNGCHSG